MLSSGHPSPNLDLRLMAHFMRATKNPPKRVLSDRSESFRLPSWRGRSS